MVLFTGVEQIKCEKNFEVCEGCGQKIHDRYLMNVGDSNWHESCLACCYCGQQLHQTCYMRNGKLYCKIDYERLKELQSEINIFFSRIFLCLLTGYFHLNVLPAVTPYCRRIW